MATVQRAIISVYHKEGLDELARKLHAMDVEILSSGGTAKHLEQLGIPVKPISEYTGSPEILGGRVKTLHPKIFGGILARDTEEHMGQLREHRIEAVDLVVVNLYPFEETASRPDAAREEVVEMIDIGGPSLIRAAAKNHERVAVVVDPADYGVIVEELAARDGSIGEELRRRLAAKAFAHTSAYDASIVEYFSRGGEERFPARLALALTRIQSLRYGENPHQQAAVYRHTGYAGMRPAVVDCEQLQGKELSYNNFLDADAALNLVMELPGTAICILKHTNPCGAATAPDGDVVEAFRRARATDPVSAFGGIVGCNVAVTEALAREMKELFLEAVVAPDFEPEALAVLKKKKKLRLLRYQAAALDRAGYQLRSVTGGVLVQDFDRTIEDLAAAEVVTKRAPTEQELRALDFAWRICKHVKSNAIVFAREAQLVGVGAGQMSRVDSVKLAATKAELPLEGTVLASDAFFPFRDGVDEAHKAGATAIVEPGGSIRDKEVIEAADEHGMAMIFTGARHFRH